MHVLFVHPNFPAQFGHIAYHLVDREGWQCSFVSETAGGQVRTPRGGNVEKIQYRARGGATRHNHFCTRTFENNVWHCEGVLRAMLGRPDLRPDLIVGHSGFGSTLFLRELFPDVPCVNLFEYYYHPHDPQSDMTFRHDLAWPVAPEKFLRSRCRNAMILLDLQNCQLGYCPTEFQRSRFPDEYADKLRVCFDGIDRNLWHGYNDELRPPIGQRPPRSVCGVDLPADARIVTYCARGFESMRGFDLFMRAVRRITQERSDTHVFIVGTDRVAYGGDDQYTAGKTFLQWTMEQPDIQGFDAHRVHFLGRVEPSRLAELLATSDVHLYLTVPFVLSWSMMNAMSCGAVVVGSDTAPVREMINHGRNGLLADFFDPDALAERALAVLADPAGHRPLGRAAEEMIREQYAMEVILPRMLSLYEEAASTTRGLEPPRPRMEMPAAKPVVEPVSKSARGKGRPSGSPFAG